MQTLRVIDRLSLDVARDLIQRAAQDDQDARTKLAGEIRQIVTAVGCGPDGLVIIEIDNGRRFIGIRRGKREWAMRVEPTTGVVDGPFSLRAEDRENAFVDAEIGEPLLPHRITGEEEEAILTEVRKMAGIIPTRNGAPAPNKFEERRQWIMVPVTK